MIKVSDLPDFAAVLEAHRLVVGAEDNYIEDEGGDTPPLARDWVDQVPEAFKTSEEDPLSPHIVPLKVLIAKIAALSGEPTPDLDETETDRMVITSGQAFEHED